MNRRHRRTVSTIGVLSAGLLLAAVSACGGSAEAEPSPKFKQETGSATPTPEVTEPPYETELNLSASEKDAADQAYTVLVKFMKANNEVMADSGERPERALRYTAGPIYESNAADFEAMRKDGSRGAGVMVHSYHHLKAVNMSEEGKWSVKFDSCVNFSKFDIVDSSGKPKVKDKPESMVAIHDVAKIDGQWKYVGNEFPDRSCES